ncbi:B12-binding domain-containing radical SAM protein [Candidatus Pseudothioglobus singularis]|nr:B12-binding domain-containing radical SAM protein [Candidatus Pseudothioglobus singularis]
MNKKANILLLSPNLKGMAEGLNRIQPPLGLMLSAAIIRNNGHKVKIHDCALEGWSNKIVLDSAKVMIGQSDEELANMISNYSPDIIGISALFSNLMDSAHNIAAIAKKVNPKIIVVLGGNHISAAIRDYRYSKFEQDPFFPPRLSDLEDVNIDFAMHGEVDFEFPRLVDVLVNGGDVQSIKGLAYKNHNDELEPFYISDAPSMIADMDSLPLPARDLVNMEGYFNIGAFHSPKSRSKRVLSVMASRGCPEKCTFCTTPDMWGAKVRWRSTENIITEIRNGVRDFDIGELQFEDDTITARKKNLMELCSELEKIGIPWCTPNGVKVNYHESSQLEMFKAMVDSGCYQITLACETGVQSVMDRIVKKKLNIESIYPAIANAKKAGMLVHTFWVLGFPGETYEEIQQTVDFAMQSGADSFSFAILSPLPGTPIYKDVIRNNLFWGGTGIDDLLYRSSLIKVDGFNSAVEFEEFVSNANFKANNILLETDPERFKSKYGEYTDSALQKQT